MPTIRPWLQTRNREPYEKLLYRGHEERPNQGRCPPTLSDKVSASKPPTESSRGYYANASRDSPVAKTWDAAGKKERPRSNQAERHAKLLPVYYVSVSLWRTRET